MNVILHRGWIALAALSLIASPALAQGNGALTTKVELEKTIAATAQQAARKIYVDPDVVVPGDRVRFTLSFTNAGQAPAAGVTVVNPIPDGLIFDGTDDMAGFGVSVDGGKNFALLETIRIPATGVDPRPATPADVTHLRWVLPDVIAPQQSRSVAFFGRVK